MPNHPVLPAFVDPIACPGGPAHPSRRQALAWGVALAATAVSSPAQVRASKPDLRSLRFIVPAPPGSQPDLIARWLAEPMALRAAVPTAVVNMPGAAGAIAADAVLRAPPDSGSLLLGGLDHVAYSHLGSGRKPLDPFVDFFPAATVNFDTWVVAKAADAPESLPQLAARSRQEPVNYASNGEGSTAHLLTARLCRAAGIEARHVAYREPWMPDLIGGRIDFVVAPTPAVLPQLQAGRLKAMATLTPARLPLPGDPPTLAELGWPGQEFRGGLFLFAPPALARWGGDLNHWFREVVRLPDVVRRYQDNAIEPVPFDLDETADTVRQRLELVDAMRVATFGHGR